MTFTPDSGFAGRAGVSESGFTLLELLLSLTIVAVIVLLVFSGLRIGVRAWERGGRDIDALQQQRIVREMLEKQIKSIVPYRIRENNKDILLFRGEEKNMEFIAGVSFDAGNLYVPVRVRLAFESGSEGLRELRWVEEEHVLVAPDRWPAEIDRGRGHVLIGDIQSASIAYLSRPEKGEVREWTTSWDPLARNGLPAAVRITMDIAPFTEPFRITVRILSGDE